MSVTDPELRGPPPGRTVRLRRQAQRRLLALALFVAAAGCLSACESSNTVTGRSQQSAVSKAHVVIVDPNHVAVRTRILGGSFALRAVIKRSLAGIGQTAITKVVVSPAGSRYRPVPLGGVVIRFFYHHTAHSTTFREVDACAEWQAGLVATATRDRSSIEGLEPVIVYFTPS